MEINEKSMSTFFSKVYLWMFIGLALSGMVAYYTSVSEVMIRIVSSFFAIIIVSELIVVFCFSLLRSKVSPSVAKVLFIVYALLSGLTLSSIFLVYKIESVGMVFISSALMFGLLALYGYVTKSDLTSLGKLLLFGLIAVIVIGIINIFLNNSELGLILAVISVVIFLGLTAYDMQNLKRIYNYYSKDENELNKAAIYGALDLYLDFVNIFLRLLQLFGKRND